MNILFVKRFLREIILKTQEKSTLGIHFFYVTLILIISIILLATTKWTELPKFTDYLSTAATITSLVLGLLAIIYAYISNDSLSQTTGIVSSAANEAQDATLKISSLVSTVEGLTTGTSKTNDKLAEILGELNNQLIHLDNTTNTLDKHTHLISEALPEIPKGLQKIEKRFEEFSQSVASSGSKKQEDLNDELLDKLAEVCIANASPAGALLMHSIYLAKTNDKNFDIKSFTDFSSPDYLWGFFMALNSVNLLDYSRVGKSGFLVTIEACSEKFSEARRKFILQIEKQKNEATKTKWTKALDDVEAFFQADT